MIVSDAMIDVLSVIRRKEYAQVYAGLSRSNPNLGNRLIKLFYQDAQSCVVNNGHMSDFLKIES